MFPRASGRLRNCYSGTRDHGSHLVCDKGVLPPSVWQRSFGLKNMGCMGAEETGCAEGLRQRWKPWALLLPLSLISCWTLGGSPSGLDSASFRRGSCLMVGNISSASKSTFCVLPKKPYSDKENYPLSPFLQSKCPLAFHLYVNTWAFDQNKIIISGSCEVLSLLKCSAGFWG